MISTLLNNLYAFALSMPTNMIILLIVCLIMKVIGKSIGQCIKVVVGYLLIGLLLGIFGITMPSFMTVGRWLIATIKNIFVAIW